MVPRQAWMLVLGSVTDMVTCEGLAFVVAAYQMDLGMYFAGYELQYFLRNCVVYV